MKRLVATVAATLLAGTGLAVVGTSASQASTRVVHVRLRTAIRHLPVAHETRRGYDRDKFRLWIDADGDCRDTRDEVLAQESLVNVHGCNVTRGKWRSYYDHVTTRRSSTFDIDHLVPLAEAWDSGANRWTAGTRTRYANDLGDRRTLVAVSAHANRSKGDRDPADWMPHFGKCKYTAQWTAVKIRWHLTVNRAEKRALADRASHCKNVRLTVRKARVSRHRSGGSGGGGGGTSGSCEPGYSPCLPVVSDLDCGQIPDSKKPIHVTGSDPYRLDSDGDGLGCES
ncbi:MAG TPA: HNH endonuclease family protein [Nocardioidaceae bacterium]|nr:HNH endonuclease family protein [Nocardioidaceae bacterium]